MQGFGKFEPAARFHSAFDEPWPEDYGNPYSAVPAYRPESDHGDEYLGIGQD